MVKNLTAGRRSYWTKWLVAHFPPGQFGRYVAVGMMNTAFGYGMYAGLTALFTGHVPFAYMLASIISSFTNITFSFLTYKIFIFKTKGNYLREWSRCIVVYSGAMGTGTLLLAPTVYLVRHLTPAGHAAPYIAGALLMTANVLAGFLGHKHFSFAQASEEGLH